MHKIWFDKLTCKRESYELSLLLITLISIGILDIRSFWPFGKRKTVNPEVVWQLTDCAR